MLIDSNIIIYASRPEYAELRRFIAEHAPAVSAISYVEVLGYHKLTEAFFAAAPILPLSSAVLDQAVHLRQQRKSPLQLSTLCALCALCGTLRHSPTFASLQRCKVVLDCSCYSVVHGKRRGPGPEHSQALQAQALLYSQLRGVELRVDTI
jgi:hypothetical protein